MNEDKRGTAGSDPGEENLILDDRSPFMTHVGPILRRGSTEVWVVRAEEKHNNIGGVVHGGMLATLLDNAMGRVASKAVGDKLVVTIQLNTYFISKASPGELIECEAQVVRAGGSIVFMQGTLRIASRIVATADGVWKILDNAG
jgi:uncharacterized protein (TIGR00369 family)